MSDLQAPAPRREVVTAKPAGPEAKAAEPLPLSPSPETGGAAAEAANADQEAASAARYRRRVLLVLSAITLALVLYWASGYVFAYTDDAYVTSDFVDVSIATLDDPDPVEPLLHTWTESQIGWFEIADHLPRYPTNERPKPVF